MANPTIPYQDLGNFILARDSGASVTSLATAFANNLINSLNAMIVQDTTATPVAGAPNPVFVNPQTNQLDLTLSYELGDGLFPKAHFVIYFGGPANSHNVAMPFTIEMFDYSRFTVTADGVSAVTGRFDISNISRKAMNAFCYGILGVALQVWLDNVSYTIFNGTAPSA